MYVCTREERMREIKKGRIKLTINESEIDLLCRLCTVLLHAV